MNLYEWNKITWQVRNGIIAFYGLKRSANVKVRSIATGVDVVDDDGIREGDIEPIAHLSVEEAISLKPLGEKKEKIKEEVLEVKPKKLGKKK